MQDPNDVANALSSLNQQLHQKEIENVRLRLTKEYELKIKEMERVHSERMLTTKQDTKKAFESTLENMKQIYDDEIKALKSHKRDLEEKNNNLRRELVRKEGDI